MEKISNNVIRQVLLLIAITLIGLVIAINLRYFFPGVLGAITLYILFRKTYFKLTEEKKWKKSLASVFLIVLSLLVIAIPLWILIEILIPQISNLLANKQFIIEKYNSIRDFLATNKFTSKINLSDENLMKYVQKLTTYIPLVLNSVGEIFVNLFTALFILYFMQTNARPMEQKISLYMPFSNANQKSVWDETYMMVRSNALGIPILALCQGLVAILGYWIFGVKNPVLWGLLTGAASIVPAVGTMIVWVPIVIGVFANGSTGAGIGLTLYCLIAVGGIDNILRFTILKRIGDIHPLITVFGVILGLKIFGVMGLIFGPLLFSYFMLLINVYRKEFNRKQELVLEREGQIKAQEQQSKPLKDNK